MQPIEKRDRFIKPGSLRPSVELGRAMSDIQKCESLVQEGGYLEYLNSINERFLGNQGTVVGPLPYISTGADPKGEERVGDRRFLELDRPWSGVECALEWKEMEGDTEKHTYISIRFSYSRSTENFSVVLYAASYTGHEETGVSVGRSIERSFIISRAPEYNKYHAIDDLLLEFTDELIDASVL